MRTIVIMGAGGFAREVAAWMEYPDYVFFSEEGISHGQLVSDLTPYKGCSFLVGVGDPKAREKLYKLALESGLEEDGLLLSKASTVATSQIGYGTIICPGVRISPDTQIGKSVILNLNSTVGHDTVIEDFVTVSPGAFISGRCIIGRGSFIGTGACIREGVKIGQGAVIGMGSAVTKSVPAGETWCGVPARRLECTKSGP